VSKRTETLTEFFDRTYPELLAETERQRAALDDLLLSEPTPVDEEPDFADTLSATNKETTE